MDDVIQRFDAYCHHLDLNTRAASMARMFIQADLNEFASQERTFGAGKTRRPRWDERYFDEKIAQAKEIQRRQQEDLMFEIGED